MTRETPPDGRQTEASAPTSPRVAPARVAPAPVAGLVVGTDGLARPAWTSRDPLLVGYYDAEWGMPVRDERGMYERVCLEGFQAGLSWLTVLRKRPALREAFDDFDPDVVAGYGEQDVDRLLANPGIIRNRQKIASAITNARATVRLRARGGLVDLIWSFQPDTPIEPRTAADVPTASPESAALAKALRGEGFTFIGPTTMFALMESIGIVDTHLLGSHRRGTSGVWQ